MIAATKLPVAILLVTALIAGATYFWQASREAELRDELKQLSEPTAESEQSANPPTTKPTSTRDSDEIIDTFAAALVERTTALFEKKQSYGMYDEIEVQIADLPKADLLALMTKDPGLNFLVDINEAKPPAPEWARRQVLRHAYRRLMQTQPQRGLELTRQSGLSPSSTSSLQTPVRAALHRWAKSDIDAAWTFLQQNAEQFSMSSRKPSRLLASLAEEDVAAALAAGEKLNALDDAMRYVAKSLRTREDRTLFFEALARLPDAETRRAAFALEFADGIQNSSGFAKMREFLETETPDVVLENSKALGLATEDYTTRPEQQVEWLAGVSEPQHLTDNICKFIDGWADEDFNAVARWLGDQGAAPWRDATVATFAKKIHPLDPEGAAKWAATIVDPTLKQGVLGETAEK